MPVSDTAPEIRRFMIERYRSMSPGEKLQIVNELTRAAQQMALARIRRLYGEISEHELNMRLASLRIDRETMIRIFNWDPEKEGY